jgi:hypothetical protein
MAGRGGISNRAELVDSPVLAGRESAAQKPLAMVEKGVLAATAVPEAAASEVRRWESLIKVVRPKGNRS